jgi:hypothetical protein
MRPMFLSPLKYRVFSGDGDLFKARRDTLDHHLAHLKKNLDLREHFDHPL